MARLPRFVIPGQPQHIILRGNNRAEIFCAEADYFFYLEKLQLACSTHGCNIHAYVLMTNHVHLLVTPHEEHSLSKAMQMLGRYYVQYYNYCYQRTGTLWEGRYKATLIDSTAYLLTCMRYIELNPVRACMVAHPSEYCLSSYHFNALGQPNGHGEPSPQVMKQRFAKTVSLSPSSLPEGERDEVSLREFHVNELVTPHLEYRRLGKSDEERQAAYRQLFKSHIPEGVVAEIREATNKAWVLGNDRFKQRIQKKLERRVEPKAKGGDRKSEQFKINRV